MEEMVLFSSTRFSNLKISIIYFHLFQFWMIYAELLRQQLHLQKCRHLRGASIAFVYKFLKILGYRTQ